MDRKTAVPAVVGDPAGFLIVAGLAGTGKDLGHLTRENDNAYLLGGAMGAAVSMGLGLALAQPGRRVLVATGDGELLMNLGALATVGVVRPANLSILCVDNGLYGETGNQQSHTALGVDLAAIAEGAGLAAVRRVEREDQLSEAAQLLRQSNGPCFVLLKVSGAPPPKYKRSFDAAERRSIFRRARFAEAQASR